MKPRWAFVIANLICGFAWGQEITVIDVHRSIALSDNEPIYRDYYLRIGDAKLRPQSIVNVYRKKPIQDPNGANFISELKIPIGQLRVLLVQGPLAVAREYKIFDRNTNPFLDIQAIMVGDLVDPKGSFVAPSEGQKSVKLDSAPVLDSKKEGAPAPMPELPSDQKTTSKTESKTEATQIANEKAPAPVERVPLKVQEGTVAKSAQTPPESTKSNESEKPAPAKENTSE